MILPIEGGHKTIYKETLLSKICENKKCGQRNYRAASGRNSDPKDCYSQGETSVHPKGSLRGIFHSQR